MLLLSFVEQVTRLELASSPHKSSLLRGPRTSCLAKNAAHRIFEVEAASSLSLDGLRKIMALSGAGKIGAGDEARTRYLHLGKVALYQMSYTCISRCAIQSMHFPGKYSRSP